MRFLRLAAAGAALTLAMAAPAIAQAQQGQQQQGGQGRGARMMEQLFKGIDLDAGQKAKVDSVVAKYRAEMPPFTPGQQPDEASRTKRREIMDKQSADIRAVLKPDQQKTFDANLAEMRERMQRRG